MSEKGATTDVNEVKKILENLQYLEKILPSAIKRWSEANKVSGANCEWVFGILNKLCENPTVLQSNIFGPLYVFLLDYIDNREGRKALTGSVDFFLKKGLRAIHTYTNVSRFFAENSLYFVDKTGKSPKEISSETKNYKEYILTLNQKLLGCKSDAKFKFLQLINNIAMPEDLSKMREYLNIYCTQIRVGMLSI